MGHKIWEVAPNLWQLLGDLLNAGPSCVRHAPMGMDACFKMEVDVDPSNIAAAIFGNDNEGSDSESSDEEGNVRGVGGGTDVKDCSMEDVTEEGATTDTDGNQKCHYQKQNPMRKNAVLLFIVSVQFTCKMPTAHQSIRGELL